MTQPPEHSAKALDDDFELGWQRIALMLENPAQFSTLFVFSGNDVLQQALEKRLQHSCEVQQLTLDQLPRSLFERNLSSWSGQTLESALSSAGNKPLENIEKFSATLAQAISVYQTTAVLADLQPNQGLDKEVSNRLIWLDLRWRLNHLLKCIGFLRSYLEVSTDTNETIAALGHEIRWKEVSQQVEWEEVQAQAVELCRKELLTRLNERRTQLAQAHTSLLLVLPLDWTKTAAQCAPDLWTVRLSSLYLTGFAGAQNDASSIDNIRPDVGIVQRSDSTILPAHLALQQHWLKAMATGKTQGLHVFDGLAAVDVSIRHGNTAQALQLAKLCLSVAYQRGSSWDQMASQGNLGDIYRSLGRLAEALEAFQLGLQIAEQLATGDPKNNDLQRDLSVSINKVASILEAQGKHAQALLEYKKSLAIREKLAASDPNNADWQRDLSVSYGKIAGVLKAQGERQQALLEYQKSLEIRQRLAAIDPKNRDWQRDLSFGYQAIASVLKVLGEGRNALMYHQKSLDICQRLAANDPSNVQWQTDLIVSYVRTSQVTPNPAQAQDLLKQALTLNQLLAAKGQLTTQQQGLTDYLKLHIQPE